MGIDWHKLEQEFSEIDEHLSHFEPPTEEELEKARLSILSFGQIKSDYFDKYDYDFTVITNTDAEYKKARFNDVWYLAKGLGFTEKDKRDIPNFLKPKDIPNYRQIVTEGIKSKKLSTDFIIAWGQYCYLARMYEDLLSQDNEIKSKQYYLQANQGLMQGTEMQEYWYAYWVRENCDSLKPKARESANEEIAELCFEIVENKITSPAPYKPEWFEKMINIDEHGGERHPNLKSTYFSLSGTSLSTKLENKIVTKEILPPLSRESFV